MARVYFGKPAPEASARPAYRWDVSDRRRGDGSIERTRVMEDGNVEYGLVEPFDIDNGELDSLAPNMIFTMGIEFAMTREQILSGAAFKRTVTTQNASRIKRMCLRHKLKFKVEPWAEHPDQWTFLTVASASGEWPVEPEADEVT